MSEAKVRKDSFWGDVANALLLSPPYRKPLQSPKSESEVAENK